MGRSPCCDKIGLKKGPWKLEEDHKLLAYIEEHGHGSWRALPTLAGLERCGKSCRLRWTNYLRPDIKRGKFSLQEEQTIIKLHALLGNRWSAIATHLPKRTDNEIKNYWNTHLKKRLTKMGIDPLTHKPRNDSSLSPNTGGQSKNSANLSHMAQWESARLEAEARLVKQSKLCITSNPPLQQQLRSSEHAAPICVDILKALNEGHNEEQCEGLKNTTNYKEGIVNLMSFETGLDDMELGWTHHSLKPDNNKHVNSGKFVEKFTELLLNNSGGGDKNSFSEDDAVSDNIGDSNGPGTGNSSADDQADNKSYWNSILNLVSSSPSDSTIF